VKQLLTKALILVPLTDGETLMLYIAATTQVVRAALVVEREEEGHALKVQCPVYFINEVLYDSKKCVFGVLRGMLLGFIVFERGIEANLEKISNIMRMGLIQNIMGVQRVIGCLVVLSRFISCLGERGLPLYRL